MSTALSKKKQRQVAVLERIHSLIALADVEIARGRGDRARAVLTEMATMVVVLRAEVLATTPELRRLFTDLWRVGAHLTRESGAR